MNEHDARLMAVGALVQAVFNAAQANGYRPVGGGGKIAVTVGGQRLKIVISEDDSEPEGAQ